jgi:hypothetical protein
MEHRGIPDKFFPDESQHVPYSEVYRAIRHSIDEKLVREDFLPSAFESDSKPIKSFSGTESGLYSVSLALSKDGLIKKIQASPVLMNKFKCLAKGLTRIERGISTKAVKGHINYFLFDYLENSPYPDFELCGVIENGK